MLNAQQIRANDVRERKVNVPRWKGEVLMIRLMADELRDVMNIVGEVEDDGDADKFIFFVEICSRCLVDPQTRKPMFADDAGRQFLNGVDAGTFSILSDAALVLHGLDDESEGND